MKEKMIRKTFVVASAFIAAAVCFGRQWNDFEDVNFCSLALAIDSDLHDANTIYELDEGGSFGVDHVNEDGTIVTHRGYKYVLIVPRSNDVVDNQLFYGPRYYRYAGVGRFAVSANSKTSTVRKFKEVSQREFEKIEEFRHELLARIEQEKHLHRRQVCLDKALAGIRELTDDEKTINFTYEKVGEKYDEAYRKTASESKAETVAKEAADALLDILLKEKEKKELAKKKEFEEWAKTHPEEYAEMLKAEEAERQRKAKLKLDAELAENGTRMEKIKVAVEAFRESNPLGIVPKDIGELRKFRLRIALPRHDVWGAEYAYECTAKKFAIISCGPDGKRGTQDDIIKSVEAFVPEQSPIAREIANRRKMIAEMSKKLDEYSGTKIPSICGFKFGSKAVDLGETPEKRIVLAKPFRKCSEAILRYSGQRSSRLTQVILVGRISQDKGGVVVSHDECRRIVGLLERNYKVRFGVVDRNGCIVAASQSDGIKVEIRNDTVYQDETDDSILTVDFEDQKLQSMITKLDVAVDELEEAEKSYAQLVKDANASTEGNSPSPAMDTIDDEGLDVLSGANAGQQDASSTKSGGGLVDDHVKKEIESIKKFRKKMEERRKEQAREFAEDARRRRLGIIESKGEGRPISTTD